MLSQFTTTIDSVAVSEEMFAEGMQGEGEEGGEEPYGHPHAADIVSSVWGSYFYYPLKAKKKQHLPPSGKNSTFQKNPSFEGGSPGGAPGGATGGQGGSGMPGLGTTQRPPSAQSEEMKRAITLRRVSSLKNTSDVIEVKLDQRRNLSILSIPYLLRPN